VRDCKILEFIPDKKTETKYYFKVKIEYRKWAGMGPKVEKELELFRSTDIRMTQCTFLLTGNDLWLEFLHLDAAITALIEKDPHQFPEE